MKDGECSKKFPCEFNDETSFGDENKIYPVLRRRSPENVRDQLDTHPAASNCVPDVVTNLNQLSPGLHPLAGRRGVHAQRQAG